MTLTSSALGATLYREGGTSDRTTLGDGVSRGQSGTWNTTTLNWDPGANLSCVPWNNDNSDLAYFGGTAGTVTLGADIVLRSNSDSAMTFTTTGYTIAGGAGYSITLAANAGITPNNTILDSSLTFNTATYPAPELLARAGSSIIKLGTGSLTLLGSSTFIGTTTVRASSRTTYRDASGRTQGSAVTRTGSGSATNTQYRDASLAAPPPVGVHRDHSPAANATAQAA